MKWIRRHVAWIAGIAVAGFLLWLIGTVVSLQAMQAESAGTLFGRKVPLQAYLQAMEAVTRQAILTHGDQFRQAVSKEDLERQAWERLTLLAEAERLRIRVSDREVVEELRQWPLFQKDGQFDREGYQVILQYSLGTSPRTFEEETRQNRMMAKLVEQATGNIALTDAELREGFRQREESIRISFLTLSEEALAREVAEAARQDPEVISQVAAQLGLKWTLSDFFKRASSIPELGFAGSILEPAFDLRPGEVTGPLSGPRGWIVVRLEAKQPADESRFEPGKEELRKDLLARKRLRAYLTWYQDLFNRASLKKSLPTPQEKRV
jgi:hypothetical protein